MNDLASILSDTLVNLSIENKELKAELESIRNPKNPINSAQDLFNLIENYRKSSDAVVLQVKNKLTACVWVKQVFNISLGEAKEIVDENWNITIKQQ